MVSYIIPKYFISFHDSIEFKECPKSTVAFLTFKILTQKSIEYQRKINNIFYI